MDNRPDRRLIVLVGVLLIIAVLVAYFVQSKRQAFPNDVLGWQEIPWGSSMEEILSSLSETEVTKLPQRRQYHGMYVDYIIPNYILGRDSFAVQFQLDNHSHGLAQILIERKFFIEHNDNMDLTYERGITFGIHLFEYLDQALTAKYGVPTFAENTIASTKRTWVFTTTSINLNLFNIEGPVGRLSGLIISYYPTFGDDLEKL